MSAQQQGFGFTETGFDTGRGQSGFNFDPESDWQWAQREKQRARQAREDRERQQQERERHRRQERQTFMGDDPYHVLGIARTATSKEIRAAWSKLCKECHPDAGGDVRKMQAVNAAYQRLKGGR